MNQIKIIDPTHTDSQNPYQTNLCRQLVTGDIDGRIVVPEPTTQPAVYGTKITSAVNLRASSSRLLDPKVIESIFINGDLSKLSAAQKVEYYLYKCNQAGLDPSAKPFDLLRLSNREILYANASATQQLTANRKLSYTITSRERVGDIFTVTCEVHGEDNRTTENFSAVSLCNAKGEVLTGEALANAMMKTVTKAIRRSVLSHCGLGMMDETEVETIQGAVPIKWEPPVTDALPDDMVQAEVVSKLPKEPIYEWTESDRQALDTALVTLQEIAKASNLDKGIRDQAVAYYQKQASEGQEPSRTLDRIKIYTEKIQAKARQKVD